MTRNCSKCGATKDILLFCKVRTYPGGYRNVCKECHRAAEASRRNLDKDAYNRRERERYARSTKKATSNKAWNDRNRDKVRAYDAQRVERRAVYKRQYSKQYYRRNVDAAKAASSQQRRSNPEYCKMQVRLWRKKNPDKHRVHLIRRRTLKHAAGPVHPSALTHVFQATCCAYCDVAFEPTGSRSLHVEHILPLARGGTNHRSNFAAACQFCNSSKHDRILYYEWLPPGVVRDRTFTPEEVEAYRVEEVARQRAALAAEATETDSLEQAAK